MSVLALHCEGSGEVRCRLESELLGSVFQLRYEMRASIMLPLLLALSCWALSLLMPWQ